MAIAVLPLLIGFFVDLLLGDPHCLPHPVMLMGKLISVLERIFRKLFPKTVRGEQWAGGVLWFTVVLISTAIPFFILLFCRRVSSELALMVESIMCWQILATKSLRDESMKVYHALESGDIEKFPSITILTPGSTEPCAIYCVLCTFMFTIFHI